MNAYGYDVDVRTPDPDDVDCPRWAQPHIPTKDLPRIKQDKYGMQAAAYDIVEEYGEDSLKLLADNRADKRLAFWVARELAAAAERQRLYELELRKDV
jgi:hypothetical protein